LKSTNLPFSLCHIFASYSNNVGINNIAYYDNTPLWIPAGTDKAPSHGNGMSRNQPE